MCLRQLCSDCVVHTINAFLFRSVSKPQTTEVKWGCLHICWVTCYETGCTVYGIDKQAGISRISGITQSAFYNNLFYHKVINQLIPCLTSSEVFLHLYSPPCDGKGAPMTG